MFATQLRVAVAIVAGVVVAILLSYAALIVFMLIRIGIPLGAESKPLTVTDSAILLIVAATAAAAGGRAAARVARDRGRIAAGGVGVTLAAMMLWAFSGRNAWPEGWGAAVAVVMAAGCWLGTTSFPRRPHGVS